tara:strand:+ start:251 stop:562 length:312 start_codon:yes stop_codon:yes gene_type:complete
MAKTEKQLKQEQASMQSDNIEMSVSSDGLQDTGDFTYSFADLNDEFDTMNVNTVSTGFTVDGLAFDNEKELREKYPALQDAWDHYKNVKHMCEQKEKENEDEV